MVNLTEAAGPAPDFSSIFCLLRAANVELTHTELFLIDTRWGQNWNRYLETISLGYIVWVYFSFVLCYLVVCFQCSFLVTSSRGFLPYKQLDWFPIWTFTSLKKNLLGGNWQFCLYIFSYLHLLRGVWNPETRFTSTNPSPSYPI